MSSSRSSSFYFSLSDLIRIIKFDELFILHVVKYVKIYGVLKDDDDDDAKQTTACPVDTS